MEPQESTTLFGEALQRKIDELGLDTRQTAAKCETTYEYIRKMLRGQAVPSKYMLRIIVQVLGMPLKETEQLLVTDRIRMKYGNIPAEISGKNPELLPIERAWPKLTEAHKDDVVRMVQTWAKHDDVKPTVKKK